MKRSYVQPEEPLIVELRRLVSEQLRSEGKPWNIGNANAVVRHTLNTDTARLNARQRRIRNILLPNDPINQQE